jgi:hypothetical protein
MLGGVASAWWYSASGIQYWTSSKLTSRAWEGRMAAPTDLEMLHCSFLRSLRAENRVPRTIETYSLVVEQLTAYLDQRQDTPRLTEALGVGTRRARFRRAPWSG